MKKLRLYAGEYHDVDCGFPDIDECPCNCDLRGNKKAYKGENMKKQIKEVFHQLICTKLSKNIGQ